MHTTNLHTSIHPEQPPGLGCNAFVVAPLDKNRTLSVATSLVSWARSPEFRSTSFSSLSSRFWFSFWTRLCDSYSRSYLSCQAMMLSSSSTCRSLSCRQALSIASSCVCLSASALFSTSISAASCTSQFCRKRKRVE
uniref:Uncharacterized protein n=1 Tax=Anopheles coluzzii TaxID=1518534 RepID=A0A8W7PIK4_ANOCL